jgi:hypothetical protein
LICFRFLLLARTAAMKARVLSSLLLASLVSAVSAEEGSSCLSASTGPASSPPAPPAPPASLGLSKRGASVGSAGLSSASSLSCGSRCSTNRRCMESWRFSALAWRTRRQIDTTTSKSYHHADFRAMQPCQICPNDIVHDLVEEEVLAVGRQHAHHQVLELRGWREDG